MKALSRVHLDVDGSLAIVRFDHAPTRNSLTEQSMVALQEIASKVGVDESIRVLLVTGVGDVAFSSGADISTIEALRRLEPEAIRDRLSIWQGALLALERLNKPVIAAINGVCVGGGAELALACDIRLAAKRARIGFPEVRLGLAPDMGSSQRLARIVGLGWAKHMILTGDIFDATVATQMGLITGVIEDERFDQEALRFAEQLATSASPRAVGVAKLLVEANFAADITTALERERSAQSSLYLGPDVAEGYDAFREKRAPNWS